MARRTLLVPSLLDDYFPLLRFALASRRWEPVLLTERDGIADLGLRYIHSDMCYPAHLVMGQVLAALRSGKYDTETCGVVVGQAGDECRGSCLLRRMRQALDRAGYPHVALLSLNVREIEPQDRMPIRPAMVFQALAGAVWGDTLALVRDQTRPYEAAEGTTAALWQSWMEELGEDLRRNRNLTPWRMLRRCREITESFRAVETVDRKVQKIAVVGEIYTKNCHLGNWDLKEYLAREHCQIAVGGLTWNTLYYMDTHALKGSLLHRCIYRVLKRCTEAIQARMIRILREAGYTTLPPFSEFKRDAAEAGAPMRIHVADGWLIAGEAVGWAKQGYRKILCIQPFACLPGHIFGKGQYAKLQRRLPDVRLVSADYDASTGEGTVQSRIRMLLDEEL